MKPKVTIGLPIYNGEKYMRESIESILNQDYQDFEFIISDNASTDSTGEICQEYAKNDKRIKYYRNNVNIGVGNNYTRVVELAEGSDYFMWSSHDDLWNKNFLSKTLTALEKNSTASLCCTKVNFIDLEGNIIHDFSNNTPMSLGLDTTNMSIVKKYKIFIDKLCFCIVYGLYRYSEIKKVMPFPNIYSGDFAFILKFLLIGDVIKVDEVLFNYRYRGRSREDYLKDLFPQNLNKNLKATTILTREIIKNILKSDLSIEIKFELQKIFIDFIKETPFWQEELESENNSPEDSKEFIIRGSIYKKNMLKTIVSNSFNKVNSRFDFNVEFNKLKNLLDSNELELAKYALKGFIKEFGNKKELIELEKEINNKLEFS